MQTNRGMLFDHEGAYNGHQPWAPLKLRDGMVLSQRGILRKSIAPGGAIGKPGPDGIVRFSGETVTIGTTLFYARIMNDGTAKLPGGVIRAKNAKALRIPLPSGTRASNRPSEAVKGIQRKANDQILAELGAKMSRARTARSRNEIKRRMDRVRKRSKEGKGPVDAIYVKSVKIPPRPFDNWTQEDQAELTAALRNLIVDLLNG